MDWSLGLGSREELDEWNDVASHRFLLDSAGVAMGLGACYVMRVAVAKASQLGFLQG